MSSTGSVSSTGSTGSVSSAGSAGSVSSTGILLHGERAGGGRVL